MIRAARACRVVFDGQSHVEAPDYWLGQPVLGFSWPRLVMGGRGLPGYEVGIGGTSITTLMTTFATRAAPFLAAPEPSIYVLCGGNQDLIDNDSAAQVYADAGAIADLARAAGADYVLCTTILPGITTQLGIWPPLYTPAQDVQRLAANALILADAAGHFDAAVDIITTGTDDPYDTASYFDGVHPYGFPASYGGAANKGTPRIAAVAAPALDAAVAEVTA